jgi:CheY-like chemotaxis protein
MLAVTVLVVEDDVLVRLPVVLELEDAGIQVLEANNADEALALLQDTQDIGYLFTDIDMPGSMDGLKLASTIRERWPHIQVLVTSGHSRNRLNELPSGSTFFPKPYNIGFVVSTIISSSGQLNA